MNEVFEEIKRKNVPEMDRLMNDPISVLDKGHIRVVDYMGDDAAIVQAARVSYGEGTKHISEDRGLIRYLMRHRHSTPFEMCELKLHVRVPMDCWRQWIRHRTASTNEYSTRYSVAIDDKQQTDPAEWRSQSKSNKQGSDEFLDIKLGRELTLQEERFQREAAAVYKNRLDCGVAREQARKDLPLSTYTEAYWKIDLHNLFHFLSLRMDSHAQKEIREFATVVGDELVAKWVPHAWEAFVDYRLEGMFLSRLDIEMFKKGIASIDPKLLEEQAELFGWLNRKSDGFLKGNRERSEFTAKAARLDMSIAWI